MTTSEPDASHPNWDDSYAGPPPPWDIGRPQPALVRLAEASSSQAHSASDGLTSAGAQPPGSRIRDQRLTG